MISSFPIDIYNSLNDTRNCISKYARIKKKTVLKEFVQILQGEIAADPNWNKGHPLKLNNDLYLYMIKRKQKYYPFNQI